MSYRLERAISAMEETSAKGRGLSPSDCRGLGLRYVPPPINLFNACGVVAVNRAWELYRDKVPCRVLSVSLADDHHGGHAVLIFQAPDGTVFAFEKDGTRRLPGIAWLASAEDTATAYLKTRVDTESVEKLKAAKLIKGLWKTQPIAAAAALNEESAAAVSEKIRRPVPGWMLRHIEKITKPGTIMTAPFDGSCCVTTTR